MAIDISNTFITLAGGCFFQAADGIEFSGQISAQQFCDTRCFQGTVSGYTSGGQSNLPPNPVLSNSTIDKFPFTSDSPATDVGELSQARRSVSGQHSPNSGYTSGGEEVNDSCQTTIEKFPFSSDTNATDIAELAIALVTTAGHSSLENGYASGGDTGGVVCNTIQKFPFSSDAPATDIANLTTARRSATGLSDVPRACGVTAGGFIYPSTVTTCIDGFPFASDANSTTLGNLSSCRRLMAGSSSDTHGYFAGGLDNAISRDIIDKHPMSSSVTATDIGELSSPGRGAAGQSSVTNGYSSGGAYGPPAIPHDTIEKFPFASDTSATDIAELTVARGVVAGHQI